jgi:ABC-type Fe3+ transport system substrate-binding protein
MQAVIDGAKQEGTVSMIHSSLITEEGVNRLEDEISEMFGVDLDIQDTPSGVMARNLSQAILEHETGATPTFDVMRFQADFLITGKEAGIFEIVDWAPLRLPGTDPDALLPDDFHGFIVIDTDYDGIAYNPDEVSPEEAPTSYYDLDDPKWEGKIAILSYSSWWAVQAYWQSGGTEEGKDEFADLLRQILANGATQGRFADLLNRYLIGEFPIIMSSSKYFKEAVERGVPAEWNFLDYAPVRRSFACVRAGSAHPNAAKLLSAYLASPEGSKWADEEAGAGNMFYPEGIQQEALEEAEAAGLPIYYRTEPGFIEFVQSGKQAEWQAELDVILKAG